MNLYPREVITIVIFPPILTTQLMPYRKSPYAHEKAIHAVEYHPLGHLLCTAGSDKTARFWSRARPNDPMAWKDAVYTDSKAGAWYYSVNNNVNAVMEDPNAVKMKTMRLLIMTIRYPILVVVVVLELQPGW